MPKFAPDGTTWIPWTIDADQVGGVDVDPSPDNTTTYLRADGTWATPAGTGVTSVSGTAPINVTAGADPVVSLNAAGVTNAYLATMADQTFKGNVSGGAAVPDDLTVTEMRDALGIYPDPAVVVYTEADFPAAVAGVITLAASTVYEIKAIVTLTTGNRIEIPATSALVGVTAGVSQIVGSYNGDLVKSIGTAGTVRYDSVRIQNNSTGASSYAVNHAVASSTQLHLSSVFIGGQGAYRCTASVGVSSSLSSYTQINASGNALDIDGGGSFGFDRCSTVCFGSSANHIRLRATATVDIITVQDHSFVASAATQTGIKNDGLTLTNRVILTSLLPQGANTGTFTVNSGWTQGTARWHVNNVTGLPDSAAIGAADLTTPVTVVVSSSATYYDVGSTPASTVWALDSDVERFALRATTGVQNGELEYTAVAQRRGLIVGGVSVRRDTGATALGCRVAVFIDGVLHSSSVASADITNRLSSIQIAPSIHVFSSTPTRIKLAIMNEDDTTDLYVERANIAAICAVID